MINANYYSVIMKYFASLAKIRIKCKRKRMRGATHSLCGVLREV